MTVEELGAELEKMVAGLTSSGFGSIDSGSLEKLDKFAAMADQLGMKEGKRMIGNLSQAMKAIQEGKSKADSGNVRLTALDYYVKKLTSGEQIEDL